MYIMQCKKTDLFLLGKSLFFTSYFFTYVSRTISRVMSWMIIYLGLPSPTASSDPPENEPGRFIVLYSVLLRMGFTWLLMLPPAR